MMKCYFHYPISKAQDFQEHLEDLLASSPQYIADEINLCTTAPDNTVILYNKNHHDRRIDEKFTIELLLPYSGEIQIISRKYVEIDKCRLTVEQMKFILKLVKELDDFENSLDYRPEKEVK